MSELRDVLNTSRRIVFLGGAGVSTESGIPDFRSASGVYSKTGRLDPEYMLSHECLRDDPEGFFAFYREHLLFPKAQPNAAHRALAELERRGTLAAVVTQNIDGLHQAAGSKTVFELHGSVHRNHCVDCEAGYDLDFVLGTTGVPRCPACSGMVRPDVVLFGEGLDGATVDGAVNAIAEADCLIVGGTSLNVYPAAGFVNYFSGSDLVLINRTPTAYDQYATLLERDSIGTVLGAAVGL